jgi:hypothetical protein
MSGARLTLGSWIDSCQHFGLEASGFVLQQRSTGAGLSVPEPLLAMVVPAPPLLPLPAGTTSAGASLAFTSSSQLWGADANALFNLCRKDCAYLDLLAGIRYLDLDENLKFGAFAATSASPPVTAAFLGDSFLTQTQFFGGQAGIRGGFRCGRWSLDGTLKVAVGDSHEVVNIQGVKLGYRNAGGAAAPIIVAAPGGIFAQPTNIGQQSRDEIAVVPELQMEVGFDVTRNVHLFVGYNALYDSNVVRPGDQVDRTVNLSQLGGTLTGPARPLPLNKVTDYWAQGIMAGVRFTF